ncbi:alpha/beta hydrolase family protein [Plebeiibacterium sediminum]|uniref:Alpha/beta fold hydrolase n=1 Tax=Plebeiibacterium sediminum TaxID=2992112 RepID=A0AAE3M8K5_9BACT|nr:alpha/beta fold hydrolase [Plebeiobacterium sediminum]MCW3789154.1 alpha/beta fold hydrolase [Plebeiobacterium sediminum]
MKYYILLIFILLASFKAYSQNISGQWNGKLKIQGIQLRVVFHIHANDTAYIATMDSPDQGAKGIPVDKVTFINQVLKLVIKQPGIRYEGSYNSDNNTIEGTFMQSGLSFPLNLTKQKYNTEVNNRPQEPQKPYPYISEEVKFENTKDIVTLAGTLTVPKKDGKFPAVVLISGSGPQNRDEEVFGHKPFLVLSDYLTRNNIAVLRFDDRGIAQSTGNFKTATTLNFSRDVEAAVEYLKTRTEIDKIGLIGHSEGGVIAPMVAANVKDIDFIVLLAGIGMPADELLQLQSELIGRAYGVNDSALTLSKTINKELYNIVKQNNKPESTKQKLSAYLDKVFQENPDFPIPGGMNKEAYIKMQVETLSSPWMSYFLKINPEPILKKVKCPVLAINGEKDLQVPAIENLNGIKTALEKGGNKNVTTKAIPHLNHLFQECQTGLPMEYNTIQETFSPNALKLIYNWIETQTK